MCFNIRMEELVYMIMSIILAALLIVSEILGVVDSTKAKAITTLAANLVHPQPERDSVIGNPEPPRTFQVLTQE